MIKNKIIFGLMLLLSACTTSEGRYGILTSRPTPLKYFEQNNHIIKEQITTSTSEGWFLFIPFGETPKLDNAIEKALQQYKGDYLSNVEIEYHTIRFLPLFSHSKWIIKGDVMSFAPNP